MIKRNFREMLDDRKGLLDADRYERIIEIIARIITTTFIDDHKVLWFGNGGSAADAQHLAAEFSGRFLRERRPLYSEALSVNSSAVTAIANDYGYEHIFERQIEAFVKSGDVVIGITTSGNSLNVVLGLKMAKKCGATVIAFTGNGGGQVAEIADISLIGPNGYSALVQEVHITLGHIICDLVEQSVMENDVKNNAQ
jgi:D-sedoheptulose 7-phosphate isomerase